MKLTVLIPLWCLVTPVSAIAHELRGPQTIEYHKVEAVTSRIHVVYGPRGFPSERTAGFMNNPAFIVGSGGVIVIDPGSGIQIGNELLKKIRSVTDKPVIAVFNTHVHGDHWLGNDAIRRAYPDAAIYAHHRMIERLDAGEGEEFVDLFLRATNGATAGTRIVKPNVGLRGGETLEIGGVRLRVHHPGRAHTETDIMIEVIDDKTVFLGDIVTERQVPSSPRPQDAYFKGQLDAMRKAANLPAQIYVPGHGQRGDKTLVLESIRFLERLYGAVARYVEQGLSDFDMKEKIEIELSEYRDWHNFSELGKVINRIYLEIEAESF